VSAGNREEGADYSSSKHGGKARDVSLFRVGGGGIVRDIIETKKQNLAGGDKGAPSLGRPMSQSPVRVSSCSSLR
jgi:hypothetical protein